MSRNLTYFVGPVVLFHPGLKANVQVKLVFLVVACPCHFFKTIGLCVNELGVLGDWLIWVAEERKSFKLIIHKKEKSSSADVDRPTVWIVKFRFVQSAANLCNYIQTGRQ